MSPIGFFGSEPTVSIIKTLKIYPSLCSLLVEGEPEKQKGWVQRFLPLDLLQSLLRLDWSTLLRDFSNFVCMFNRIMITGASWLEYTATMKWTLFGPNHLYDLFQNCTSKDNSDREGNFIASIAIAEVVGGNYGEPSDVDDKEDIEFKASEGSEDESKGPLGQLCNFGSGSQISANIDRLLAEMVSKTPSNGFIATSYGKNQYRVFGLAQCRGDVSTTDCSSCIQDAAKQIRQRCPNQVDARIWYDFCFLRYNTINFIGEIDTYNGLIYGNVEYVSDPDTFNKELETLSDQIRAQAVETRNEGLGKGKTKLSTFVTLYALVQCTRDLALVDCAQCLAIAAGNFEKIFKNRTGCRILYSSCYVRYALYPFFFPLDSKPNDTLADTVMAILP
nr:cysteine-rich repeat secretory protein 55 [Quercus suber]